MSTNGWFTKDPQAVLPFTVAWHDYLGDGDTLATSTWLAPAGITVDSSTYDTTTTTVWLSGGTLGEDYQLTNRITSTEGITDDRTITIRVRST